AWRKPQRQCAAGSLREAREPVHPVRRGKRKRAAGEIEHVTTAAKHVSGDHAGGLSDRRRAPRLLRKINRCRVGEDYAGVGDASGERRRGLDADAGRAVRAGDAEHPAVHDARMDRARRAIHLDACRRNSRAIRRDRERAGIHDIPGEIHRPDRAPEIRSAAEHDTFRADPIGCRGGGHHDRAGVRDVARERAAVERDTGAREGADLEVLDEVRGLEPSSMRPLLMMPAVWPENTVLVIKIPFVAGSRSPAKGNPLPGCPPRNWPSIVPAFWTKPAMLDWVMTSPPGSAPGNAAGNP